MIIYREVDLPLQIGCDIDDEKAERLLKESRDEKFETRLHAVRELLRLTDNVLEQNVKEVYQELDRYSPIIYIPSYCDYETSDDMEDVDGNVIDCNLD